MLGEALDHFGLDVLREHAARRTDARGEALLVSITRVSSGKSRTMARYGLRGTPSCLVLDRLGRVQLHHFGQMDDLALGALLGALLAAPLDATSLGGVESLIERRARWAGDAAIVGPTLCRMSVGIEDVEDIWRDLDTALVDTLA